MRKDFFCKNLDIPKNHKFSKFSIGTFKILLKWDIESIRNEFPLLNKKLINGNSLIWFDNGATTHKPQRTINKINEYYSKYNSNVHRSAHQLAKESTEIYEGTREQVKKFINAEHLSEIIFVRGTTEGINLIANSFGKNILESCDTVLITEMEHHANIVPWQLLQKEIGFNIDYVSFLNDGSLDINELETKLCEKVKILSLTHVSNVLGTINPINKIVEIAHKNNTYVIVDGAQSIAHMPIDVQKINCDFFTFSSHKLYGPTGIGIVYGKKKLLDDMPPWQGGGHMVKDVTLENTTFQESPRKFEAGTGSLSAVAGLFETLKFMESVNWEDLINYENFLNEYMLKKLLSIEGLTLFGTSKDRLPIFSFVIKNINLEDLSKYLNEAGISVRLGHHCAQPSIRRFGYDETIRASLSIYNTIAEIDIFIKKITDFLNTKISLT